MQVRQDCSTEDIADILKKFSPASHAKSIESIAKKTVEIINELIDVSDEEDPIKNIVKNPATIKQMAEQIITATDAYFS
jgi:hypothetical protein